MIVTNLTFRRPESARCPFFASSVVGPQGILSRVGEADGDPASRNQGGLRY